MVLRDFELRELVFVLSNRSCIQLKNGFVVLFASLTTPGYRGELSRHYCVVATNEASNSPLFLEVSLQLSKLFSVSRFWRWNRRNSSPGFYPREAVLSVLSLAVFEISYPWKAVSLPWHVYMGQRDSDWESYPTRQTEQPTSAGYPTHHVNVIMIKWEIIWIGGLPHLLVTVRAEINFFWLFCHQYSTQKRYYVL